MNIYVSDLFGTQLDYIKQNQLGYEIMAYANPGGLDNFNTLHPKVTQNMEGLKNFSMHGTFDGVSYTTGDQLIFEATRKRFLQNIQAASFHGVERLVFHSAYRRFFRFHEELTKYFVNTSITFWKDIEQSIPDGMTVFIENVEDEDPHVFADVIGGIESPKIKCCFDIGHAYVFSPVPLDTWVKVLGSKIGHVHINDNDGKNDSHMPLGKGSMSPAETIHSVKKYAGENVPFVLECDAPASIDWLMQNRLM